MFCDSVLCRFYLWQHASYLCAYKLMFFFGVTGCRWCWWRVIKASKLHVWFYLLSTMLAIPFKPSRTSHNALGISIPSLVFTVERGYDFFSTVEVSSCGFLVLLPQDVDTCHEFGKDVTSEICSEIPTCCGQRMSTGLHSSCRPMYTAMLLTDF